VITIPFPGATTMSGQEKGEKKQVLLPLKNPDEGKREEGGNGLYKALPRFAGKPQERGEKRLFTSSCVKRGAPSTNSEAFSLCYKTTLGGRQESVVSWRRGRGKKSAVTSLP